MTTPPSLPPAMDPHQMNATPPCPKTYRISERPVEYVKGRTWAYERHGGWWPLIDRKDVDWLINDDDTHWCFSDTKPTHDPKETPCPNATPAPEPRSMWYMRDNHTFAPIKEGTVQEIINQVMAVFDGEMGTYGLFTVRDKPDGKIILQLSSGGKDGRDKFLRELRSGLITIDPNWDAPAAPLPTVAPHYAGLVERLENRLNRLELLTPGLYHSLKKDITDAIDAMTDGAREHAKVWEKLDRACRWNEELGAKNKTLQTELTDLRQKLAASERECVRLRASADHWEQQTESWNRMAVELGCLIGVSDNEVPWFDLCKERANALRTQLAAAKLDADALAGALEEVRACIFPSDLNEDITKQVKQVLAAHRARGAAGGKK